MKQTYPTPTHRTVLGLALAGAMAAGSAAAGTSYSYHNVFDGTPLDVPQRDVPEPVATFHETGTNPFVDAPEAIARGKDTYQANCQQCHMPDGSGRIGPNFLDDQWHYDATATMRGRFAIVYAGGAGAMQAFHQKLSQREILEVLAYIEKLRGEAEAGE